MQAELEWLYPFLTGRTREVPELERALAASIAAKAAESRATSEQFFAESTPVLLAAASAIQEAHVAAYHILWDLVHTLLAGDRGAAAHEVAP